MLGAPRSGFTLVEFVIVIVMLGIVAAAATPRFLGDRTFVERGYYEELAAALRYAQKLAVATGCGVRVDITSAGYVARQQQALGARCDAGAAAWGKAIALADGKAFAGGSPSGVAVAPSASITFDALGRPDLASDQTINVGPFALTVRAETGFVHAR